MAEPDATVFDVMKDRFHRHEESIRTAVDARSRERLKYLESTIARRKESEVADLRNVLDDLENGIRKELADQGPTQIELQLWPEDQRNQLSRDIDALEARLKRIPEEREREISTIERRYANSIDRTFPVAVMFLVPDSQTTKAR